MRHTISNPDSDTMLGECAVCGPNTPLVFRSNKYYRCRLLIQKQKREWAAKTYNSEDNRWKLIRNVFNMTPEQWVELFESQGRKCAVCKSPDPIGRGWHIDHNHECCAGRRSCGKCIRGILCSNCNTALGLLKDNKEFIMNAIEYLA